MTSNQIQLNTLSSNLSKHFIFNTLNSINSYIIDEHKGIATDYLAKFGKLLRLVIDNSEHETITLAKELEALDLYIYMEKMRFNNGVVLDIRIDKNIDETQIMVPSLVLQPYIEVAIWNSLSTKKVPNKIILEINLSDKNKIVYNITQSKTLTKPKLRQAPMPHETLQMLKNSNKWIFKNSLLFNVETIDLYNEAKVAFAQKTIIEITLT